MKLIRLTPELMVEDVEKTVNFYVNTLGFKLTNQFGDPKMTWANVMWGDSEVGLMFMESDAWKKEVVEFNGRKTEGTMVQFIEAEGIEELYEKVKNKVEIVFEYHETPYGTKEFTIRDLNGYLLAFAERI